MSIEDAFLGDVLEHPDEDTPRLAYADWLTDRGDPHGEFIAVQCELARRVADPDRRLWLEDRERALLREHEPAWAGPLLCRLADETFELGKTTWGGSWAFRRGFVEAVELAAPQAAEHGAALAQLHPVRELTLAFVNRDPPDLPALAAAAAELALLRGVETLTLLGSLFPDESRLTDAVLDAVLASPALGRLRRLRLQDCSASFAHTLTALQTMPAAAALEQLEIDHYLQDSDLAALAASPLLARIRQLDLWLDIDATPDGLRALLTSPHLVALRRLHAVDLMPGSRMALEGVEVLAQAAALAGLEALELDRIGLTADGLRSLFASPHLGRLRQLTLTDNRLGSEGARVLAELACLAGLEELGLANTQLHDAGLAALAAAPFFPRLRRLDLSGNHLRSAGVAALDRLERIEHLDLSRTFLGGEGVKRLAAAPFLPRLRELSLAGVRPGDEPAAALLGGSRLGCLRRLDLSGGWGQAPFGDARAEHSLNGLGDTTAFALAGSPGVSRLSELDLSSNSITDAGVAALANAPHLAGLEALSLENNLIGDAGARALAQSPALAALKSLKLGHNAIRDWAALHQRFGRRLHAE